MFKAYPSWEDLFQSYKREGVPLLENPKFLKHVQKNVMDSFTFMVDNLGDEELLKTKMYELGIRHAPRKVGRTHFNCFSGFLVEIMKKYNGARFDGKAEAAWKQLLLVSMDIISNGAEEN
jgi:hypothetical protein